MKSKQPGSGEVWSLRLPPELEDTPAPLVILLNRTDEYWTAVPVFGGDLLAGESDLALSEEEDFLDGYRWVAAKDAISIEGAALWKYLERIPASTIEQVKLFRSSGACSLSLGNRLLPELGDPRIKLRDAAIELAQRCAKYNAKHVGVLVLEAVGTQVKAVRRIFDQAKEELKVALTPTLNHFDLGTLGLGIARGAAGIAPFNVFSFLMDKRADGLGERPSLVSFKVGNFDLELLVSHIKSAWQLGIKVANIPALQSVVFQRGEDRINCIQVNDYWVPDSGELKPGRYLVTLKTSDESISFPVELTDNLAG